MASDFDLSRREQATALYRLLLIEEESIGNDLNKLLEQQSQMDLQISSFKNILPSLQKSHTDSQGLFASITKASTLADSISKKVKVLDTAKRNVYTSLKRVEDVIDLKNCVDGVQSAMSSGNYEQAAIHIRRYLDLDEAVLLESAADAVKGTTVSNSFALLKNAELNLRNIITERLTAAVDTHDRDSVVRFVKILPLLNQHDEGVHKLTQFINNQIKESGVSKLDAAKSVTGDRAGIIYADTLMSLYEDIAHKLDVYLSIIENDYGSKWITLFLERIQRECDAQVEAVLNQMSEERMLEHKTQTVGVALNSRYTAGAIRPDPRELDMLLSELSLCSSRTELFFRFVIKKSAVHVVKHSELPYTYHLLVKEVTNLLKSSGTSLKIQETIGWYILIEHYFMRESLSKAISVDHSNPAELVSSLPDDAFFVLQKSLKRSFSTCNIDGSCAMINNASSLLGDYRNELVKKINEISPNTYSSGIDLSDFPSMFQSSSTVVRSQSLPGGDKWKALGVACSNIEISCQNLKKLIKELQGEITRITDYDDGKKAKLDTCLSELCSASAIFQEVRLESITKFIETLLLPGIKTAVDKYSSQSHEIDEDLLVENDFIQRLALLLSQLLDESKSFLFSDTYEDLVLQVVSDLSVLLEEQIFASTFNQLGGVQLDRDLRQLISFLSNRTQHPIRDKFARLLQMANILSLEKVEEVLDYWSVNSGVSLLHMTSREVKQVLRLRKDFRTEPIDRLNLSQLRD